MSERVKVDYKDKCKCPDRDSNENKSCYMVNYSMMWHEEDVLCNDCHKFVRFWDAG